MNTRLIRHIVGTLFLIVASVLSSAELGAQDVSQLYSKQELRDIGSRYEPNLHGLWNEDFLSRLTPTERSKSGLVELRQPLFGIKRSPMEFYSDPDARKIYVPTSSVKFLDDIFLAFAYYEKMGCDLGAVSDYAAALRFRDEELFDPPLDALGVPPAAFNDPYVDDVAQKMLKSIIFFVVAHEYAHVMYQHEAYSSLLASEAQQQESQADVFALDVMRRIGVPPIALAHFFLITSRLEASPGDFNNLAEYEWHLQQGATHPVSTLRLFKVAEAIEGNEEQFSSAEPNAMAIAQELRESVATLRTIASTLDDRKMRLFLAQRARDANIASFRFACQP